MASGFKFFEMSFSTEKLYKNEQNSCILYGIAKELSLWKTVGIAFIVFFIRKHIRIYTYCAFWKSNI